MFVFFIVGVCKTYHSVGAWVLSRRKNSCVAPRWRCGFSFVFLLQICECPMSVMELNCWHRFEVLATEKNSGMAWRWCCYDFIFFSLDPQVEGLWYCETAPVVLCQGSVVEELETLRCHDTFIIIFCIHLLTREWTPFAKGNWSLCIISRFYLGGTGDTTLLWMLLFIYLFIFIHFLTREWTAFVKRKLRSFDYFQILLRKKWRQLRCFDFLSSLFFLPLTLCGRHLLQGHGNLYITSRYCKRTGNAALLWLFFFLFFPTFSFSLWNWIVMEAAGSFVSPSLIKFSLCSSASRRANSSVLGVNFAGGGGRTTLRDIRETRRAIIRFRKAGNKRSKKKKK